MPKNLYVDLSAFSRQFATGQTLDATDVTEIEKMAETCSRRVDGYCKRHFFALTETNVRHGNGCDTLRVPDLISATSIKLDENSDGVFEYTMVAADYWLEREFGDNIDVPPFDLIRLNPYTGTRLSFMALRRLVQIVGSWGYNANVERLAPVVTLTTAADTSMDTDTTAGLAPGQTLLIEAEQVYVSAVGVAGATAVRGVNGTTAIAHASKPVDLYVYEPAIRDATLMMLGRMWQRKDTKYSDAADSVFMGIGGAKIDIELDGDVRVMLAPYRRLEFAR